MSPSEKEFGELIGEVKAIGRQIADMERRNSEEHAAVITRLDGLRSDLDRKASEEWVKEHDGRIDSLEQTRDEGKGAAWAVKFAQGVGLFLIGLLGLLLAKGGV